MAKKPITSTELTPAEEERRQLAATPSYLQDFDGATGVDDLQDYISPARLKIVQHQSTELLDDFNAGNVIIMPQRMLVDVDPEQPLLFTPVLFFPEWCCWNALDLARAGQPVILDRTLDRNSGLAKKCKNSATWEETHPTDGKYKVKNSESLNFIGIIHGSEMLAATPVAISFVRAEHRYGSNFASLIKMRRLSNSKPAPIYSGVYSLKVDHRKNKKGNWFGFTPGQSALVGASPWVSEEQFPLFRELHESLYKSLQENKIRVDYDDVSGEDVDVSDTAKF